MCGDKWYAARGVLLRAGSPPRVRGRQVCLLSFGEFLNVLRRAGLPRRTVRRCFLIESPVRGVHELSWDFSVELANNGLDRRRGPTLRISELEKLRKIEL